MCKMLINHNRQHHGDRDLQTYRNDAHICVSYRHTYDIYIYIDVHLQVYMVVCLDENILHDFVSFSDMLKVCQYLKRCCVFA